MKISKLMGDIIRAKERELSGGVRSPFIYGLIEKPNGKKAVGVLVRNAYVVIVPEERFYLDLKKVFGHLVPVDLEKLVDWTDLEYSDPAVDTGVVRTITDNHKVKVLETDPADAVGDTVWIAVNTLTYYEEDRLEYKATEKNKPVYFIEDDDLVGVIMPVNHA